VAGAVSVVPEDTSSLSGTTGPGTKAISSFGTVGEVGLYRECRLVVEGAVAVCVRSSLVIGKGCIDLRREDMVLLGFMWNDRRDMALRKGSLSPLVNSSLKGDCGAGDDSREVLRVPAPDTDVAVDMNEYRDRPRSWSSCT
jgi:hypothetical protein